MTTTDLPPRHLEFSVEGMSCGSCAARVERILRARPGVVAASVNLATRRAVVDLLPLAGDTFDQDVRHLTEAVARAGYRLEPGAAGYDVQHRRRRSTHNGSERTPWVAR